MAHKQQVHTWQESRIHLQLADLHIALKVLGQPNPPPIIAIHGWLDNANSFDLLAPLIPNQHIIAIDLPGHGLSDYRPPGAIYHFWDWIADLHEIVTELGLTTFSLLGHSMGAAIATLYAGIYSEHIAKLILIDGIGPVTSPVNAYPDLLKKMIAQRTRNIAAQGVYPSMAAAIDVRAKVGKFAKQYAQILATRGVDQVASGYSWRYDPRLKLTSPARLTEPQVGAFITRIKCPTLIIKASHGLLTEHNEIFSQRVALLNQFYLEEIDGGHHVHMENAEAVAAVVNKFLC